jgi:hypothetical protein
MRVKGKRVLKNGTIAGYVYYKNEKKWKWRFISGKKMKGGENVEAGSTPIFVDRKNKVIILGLIDCIGVVIRRFNADNRVDGIIAGHFLTRDMTNIKFDVQLNRTTLPPKRTFELISSDFTESGIKFVERMRQLMEENNFEHRNISYYSGPMLTGKFHKNVPEAVRLLNNRLGEGTLIKSSSRIEIPIF